MIYNKSLCKWLSDNKIDIRISFINNCEWVASFVRDNVLAEHRTTIVSTTPCNIGRTPKEAFDMLCMYWSGKKISFLRPTGSIKDGPNHDVNDHWIEYQFPIIIFDEGSLCE